VQFLMLCVQELSENKQAAEDLKTMELHHKQLLITAEVYLVFYL